MEGTRTRKSFQKMGKQIKRQIIINQIPQDIIEDIFLNLPVKSLLRFKSVSKPWRCLISSKLFTEAHLKKSSDLISNNLDYRSYSPHQPNHGPVLRPLGVGTGCRRSLRSYSVKSFLDEQNYDVCWEDIVGSCNGLILICSPITFDWCDLILWNPSTRQVKIIPPPPYARRKKYRFSDQFVYGFGHDDSTDDYKIVSIFVSKPAPHRTHMYSLRTNSWKKIGSFEQVYIRRGPSGTHVNGKLHWVASEREWTGDRNIVSISLVDGKYDIVPPPPPGLSEYDGYDILYDMGGYLGLMTNDSTLTVRAWVMIKYGEVESWTNIRTFSDIGEPRGPINGAEPRPIGWTKNGDAVVAFIGSANVASNRYKRSCHPVYAQILLHKIYVETLVSPYDDE